MIKLDLAGKTALVCGSSQGIGRASAHVLAEHGATVVLLARNATRLKAVLQELPAHDRQQHSMLVADFSEPNAVATVVESIATQQPVHILVNNTGGPPGGPITQAEPQAFADAFQQHLLCNHVLVQAVLPKMKDAAYGRIINIISTSVKQPLANLGVSNTIRAAVGNWAKTLANEVGRYGITVNNVLPGATRTARLNAIIEQKAERTGQTIAAVEAAMKAEIPAGRFADPVETAAAVAFLASPAAAYINGINLPVDGGRTRSL